MSHVRDVLEVIFNANQPPQDGSRVNSRNVVYIKYNSDSGQYQA
jgi:hypothetical protein